MPGHKGNSRPLKRLVDYRLDVTELDVIDNERAVKNAEHDCAKLLNAKRSFILSDGTSLAILALVYAVKNRGKKLIISRSSHTSVFNALKLFSIEPVFFGEEEDGLSKLPISSEIDSLIDDDVIGALITCPDYFGRVCDLAGIKEALVKRNKLLLIDGAHGAHLAFSDRKYYAGNYADAWAESAHKTLDTINQGSILSVNDETLIDGILEGVKIFSTTSPSYLILGSVEYGIKKASKSINRYIELKKRVERLKISLNALGTKIMETEDSTKIVIDLEASGLDGKQVANKLDKYRIYPELISNRFVLFMLSISNTNKELRLIETAFRDIMRTANKGIIYDTAKYVPVRKMGYLDAVNSSYDCVLLDDACGRISQTNLGIFPPCYPTVIAGEVIDENAIKILNTTNVFGVENGRVRVIKER